MFQRGLIFLLLVALSATAWADDTNKQSAQRQAELDNIRSRIANVKDNIRKDRAMRDNLAANLQKVEKELAAVTRTLSILRNDTRSQQQRIQALEQRRHDIRKRLAAQRAALSEQLRASYLAGRQQRTKLLLAQEDASRTGRMLGYYDYLTQAQQTLITTTKSDLAALANIEDEVGAANKRFSSLTDKRRVKLKQLSQKQRQRDQLLKRIDQRLQEHGKALQALQLDEKNIQQLLNSLKNALATGPKIQRTPFAEHRGTLPVPVKGQLLHRYGEARAKGKMRWNGLFFSSPTGTEVHSIAHGRVAFADWLPRLGLLVVIEHGDGYMSLYAHNQTILVGLGDWVEAGQPLATVGDTGGRNQPGLYFEIRKDSRPLNPGHWCKLPKQTPPNSPTRNSSASIG